jgi:hypothetical protein
MPPRNVMIAIGVVVAAVVVLVTVVVIVALFAFPEKELLPEKDLLPSTITYEFSFRTFVHERIDIAPDIISSLDEMKDDESVIAMYRTSTESMYNYTILTKVDGVFKLYYLNSAYILMYEPISINSIEDLTGVETVTKASDSSNVFDVTITVESL